MTRNLRIALAHVRGVKLEALAAEYGVSRQRVHQIVRQARRAAALSFAPKNHYNAPDEWCTEQTSGPRAVWFETEMLRDGDLEL